MVFYYYRPVSPISNSGTSSVWFGCGFAFCILTDRPTERLTDRPTDCHFVVSTPFITFGLLLENPSNCRDEDISDCRAANPSHDDHHHHDQKKKNEKKNKKQEKSRTLQLPFEFLHGLLTSDILSFTYCVREALFYS